MNILNLLFAALLLGGSAFLYTDIVPWYRSRANQPELAAALTIVLPLFIISLGIFVPWGIRAVNITAVLLASGLGGRCVIGVYRRSVKLLPKKR